MPRPFLVLIAALIIAIGLGAWWLFSGPHPEPPGWLALGQLYVG
jgi:hypothetical protein